MLVAAEAVTGWLAGTWSTGIGAPTGATVGIGGGVAAPAGVAAAAWLAGDEADFNTAVDTHLM